MVHAEDIEYQFGWWAHCQKHPEARNDRENYPDCISLIVGLDGGYHESLFYNFMMCSRCGRGPNFRALWLDLLDNWEHYDAMFRQRFIDRYVGLKRYIEDRCTHHITSTPKENQKLFTVMEDLNNNYLHLNVSINVGNGVCLNNNNDE
jgi:hypothetical protein